MTLDLFTLALIAGAGVLAYLLYRLINCTDGLEWRDLVATQGSLNAYKIGYWVGSIIGSWVIVKQSYMGQLDASTFAVYLGFLGGVNVLNSLARGPLAPRPGGGGYRYSPDMDFSGDDPEEPLQGRPGRDTGAVRSVQRSSFTTREGSRGEGKTKGGR